MIIIVRNREFKNCHSSFPAKQAKTKISFMVNTIFVCNIMLATILPQELDRGVHMAVFLGNKGSRGILLRVA